MLEKFRFGLGYKIGCLVWGVGFVAPKTYRIKLGSDELIETKRVQWRRWCIEIGTWRIGVMREEGK